MATLKRSKTHKGTLTDKGLGVYISLLTDFGFKRVFGIKEMMLNFFYKYEHCTKRNQRTTKYYLRTR